VGEVPRARDYVLPENGSGRRHDGTGNGDEESCANRHDDLSRWSGMNDLISTVLQRRFIRPPAQVAPAPVLRWAAVAVILVPEPDALLLVRRAERSGDPWSGQMALPGGRREAEEDLLFTAIRETGEEVGLVLPPESLVGVLDDMAPRTPVLPPIAVRPYVFRLERRPSVSQVSEEIAATHWVPLETLLNQEYHATADVLVRSQQLRVPAFRLEEGTVWGMTERILSDLLRTT
jgi:8-oxo-dGTP pyrophosphatase MutT (NUDIX family)